MIDNFDGAAGLGANPAPVPRVIGVAVDIGDASITVAVHGDGTVVVAHSAKGVYRGKSA